MKTPWAAETSEDILKEMKARLARPDADFGTLSVSCALWPICGW